jgi:predicted anti-sigma-YlaC factor YlaD
MSRVHRLRRRVGQSAATHERARTLAATRVDFALDPVEAAWLEAHLGSCEACRSVAVGYDADRLALRAMRDRQPVPPRDLWARTSAAIERESASRGGRSRRAGSPRRRSIPLGALSGVAVIAVVIGASVLSGGFINGPRSGGAGGTPPIAVVPTSRIPGATPMAVGVGSVEWVGTSSNGGLAYSSDTIEKVCPTDRQPATRSRSTSPSSPSRSRNRRSRIRRSSSEPMPPAATRWWS